MKPLLILVAIALSAPAVPHAHAGADISPAPGLVSSICTDSINQSYRAVLDANSENAAVTVLYGTKYAQTVRSRI
jgi:hypothetical protein